MLLTNHTLTGIALGLTISNPVALAPLAFGSHFVLDSLPHFGQKGASFHQRKWFWLAIGDCFVCLVIYLLALSIWPDRWLGITIGAFFATLPDLLYIPRFFWGYVPSPQFAAFHSRIQWGETPRGIIVELAWAWLMCALLKARL